MLGRCVESGSNCSIESQAKVLVHLKNSFCKSKSACSAEVTVKSSENNGSPHWNSMFSVPHWNNRRSLTRSRDFEKNTRGLLDATDVFYVRAVNSPPERGGLFDLGGTLAKSSPHSEMLGGDFSHPATPPQNGGDFWVFGREPGGTPIFRKLFTPPQNGGDSLRIWGGLGSWGIWICLLTRQIQNDTRGCKDKNNVAAIFSVQNSSQPSTRTPKFKKSACGRLRVVSVRFRPWVSTRYPICFHEKESPSVSI